MRTPIFVAAVAALALPTAASAADWWWTQSSDKSRSMIERSSIARNGAWATAWPQDFFVAPRGLNLFSARYLAQHDCARGEVTILSAQAFDGDGQPLAAPIPERRATGRDDLREICENDWSRATQVGDLDGEVRTWRLLNDN